MVRALHRGRDRRPQQLLLPQSLKDEVADADQDRFGAQASALRCKRGRSRKEMRQQHRLQKKQRRAQYNDRLRRKPNPESVVAETSLHEEDAVEPVENDDDDDEEVVESAAHLQVPPRTSKKPANAIHELDQEIAELEKKLGGNSDKLRRELDDDGLLDLYDAVDGVLSTGGDGSNAFDLDSEEEAARAEQFRMKAEIRRQKQAQLYGASTDDGARYVPPALRESAGEVHVRKGLTRTVVGQLNRLSESNLEPILNSIKVLFERHPRGVLTEIVCDSVLQLCCGFETVAPPISVSLAGLMTALNVEVGSELGAVFCERLAHAFQASYASADPKPSLNLARFLATLYTFQMVSSAMIYDLIRTFIDAFTELDIDLILALVSTSGLQLRRDDPGALKAIVLQMQAKTAAVPPTSRTAFVLEMIYDLKNNKPRQVSGQLDALRAWLRQRFPDGSKAQIRVGWHDLLNSEKTGRWWLVGSAWKGRPTTFSGEKSALDHVQATVENADNDLVKLARARRMNTDVRRAVFCVVMGAADYLDAFEKIVRLSLRPPGDKDVVAVIFDCCSNEKAWNPYYGHLSAKLCSYQRSYKFTFQLGFSDFYKTLTKSTPRQVSNLARLLGHLISEFYISLSHLKSVDFLTLDATGTLFFMVLFKTILKSPKEVLGGVFQRISASSQLESVRDSIRLFFRSHLQDQVLEEQIQFAQRCMDRTDALDAL